MEKKDWREKEKREREVVSFGTTSGSLHICMCIPWRYFTFSSRPQQWNKYHNKISKMIFFLFLSAHNIREYTKPSIKCEMALWLKNVHNLVKSSFLLKNSNNYQRF